MCANPAPKGVIAEDYANLDNGELLQGARDILDGDHYHVDISHVDKDTKKPLPPLQRIWNQMVEEATGAVKRGLDHIAYDQGKSFYTTYKVPLGADGKLEIIIDLKEDGVLPTGDERQCIAVMQAADHMKIDFDLIKKDYCKGDTLTEQARYTLSRTIMAMQVLMRQDPAKRFAMSISASRKRFTSGNPATLLHGYPVVNNHRAYLAYFEPGMLTDIAPKLFGPVHDRPYTLEDLSPSDIKYLTGILRRVNFTVTHRDPERVGRITRVTAQSAEDLKFRVPGKDGQPDRTVSVAQQFQEQYKVPVTRPHLPCVQYRDFFLPMEFVKILAFNPLPMMMLTANHTAEIIEDAAKPPPLRQGAIGDWHGNRDIRADFHGWNMKGVRFTQPDVPLKSWAIVSFDQRCTVPDLQKFVTYFCPVLSQYGCPVVNQKPSCFQYNPDTGGPNMGVKAAPKQAAKNAYIGSKVDPQIIFCVVPRNNPSLNQAIEAISCEQLLKPVPTQCLQPAMIKCDRAFDEYCREVAMDVHSKLGGVTHQVQHQIPKTTVMVVADTGHAPARGASVPPPVAVAVPAVNNQNTKSVPGIPLQEGRVEIIQKLRAMLYTHIGRFEMGTGAKPTSVLFFRAGITSQYAHCIDQELASIKKAAHRFGGGYNPKVTFVICPKRIVSHVVIP
ncbi:hypothetical protein I350_06393 [Cryptococcus amylolentus CBS 6273]|uniref:Piwi domain-containing protein n=1 Tax=Cryptococcus amylolentus CBS 6273 TaxID=1296118 RepID=A0A1E3JL88_9TREE|nr:hypothetical protein I350_06393 [Cryptococcus amylolentus CBS 6273]